MRMSIAIMMCVVFFAGCEIMPPYQAVDFMKTADGKLYMRDTPRTWNYIKENTDRAIEQELKGIPPGGGIKSWNENWVRVIRITRDGGQENPEKYVAYIVQRRRELGLSEIVFPPSS